MFAEDRIEGRRGQELQWTRLCGNPPVIRTREELLDFAMLAEGLSYELAISNCQDFVFGMLQFACGYRSFGTAFLAVLRTVGTLWF